jgi:predicted dehydrogenase
MQRAVKVPRVGLIGAGGFGSRHVQGLLQLMREGLCQVVAACDPKLENLPLPWGEPLLEEVSLFRGHEEMLRAELLDYIIIASPPHWHEEHCLSALETGAFVYLEKPPVPTIGQLRNLLEHPGADRVAVGFQILETAPMRDLKKNLVEGKLGTVREVWASGLWPRMNWYYERAQWAGRMMLAGRPVCDGPLTNAMAHLVQNVFYLAGNAMDECAKPETAAGCFARAREIESYDFGWIRGRMDSGVVYNILAGHCGQTIIPWKVSIRTDRGLYSVGEVEVAAGDELLLEAHRYYLSSLQSGVKIKCGLADCLGYSMATSTALSSAPGIVQVPASKVTLEGAGSDTVYHVETLVRLIEQAQNPPMPLALEPAWLSWGDEVDCQIRKAPTEQVHVAPIPQPA